MNTAAFIDLVVKSTGISSEICKKVVEATFTELQTQVSGKGQDVNIRNFGKFKQRIVPAGKRIVAGKYVDVPEDCKVQFVAPKIRSNPDEKPLNDFDKLRDVFK